MKNFIRILLFYILALYNISYAQNVSAIAKAGQNATFNVSADGTLPFTYQWKKDGVNIAGATSVSYVLTNVTVQSTGNYTVEVANPIGTALSNIAALTVINPPIFTVQPVATNVKLGNTLTLTSFASVSVYFYTVGTDNNIYEISDTGKKRAVRDVSTLVGATPTNSINGAAFDIGRGQFFFAAPNTTGTGPASLWYWNQVTNATPINLGTLPDVRPDNAAYWDDAYWYIQPGTLILRRIALQYDKLGSPTMVSGGASSATLTGGVPTAGNNYIGDIDITSNGTLYATTSNGASFYTTTLSSGPLSGTKAVTSLGTVGSPAVPKLQISFGPAGTTLYGQSFDTGQWYTMSTTNGSLTPLSFSTLVNGATNGFQDVSGVSATPSPPITDLGAGTISYQWYKDNVAISGATSSAYTVISSIANTGGTYKVVATRTLNGVSSSTDSNLALVTVTGGLAPSNVKIIISVGP